MRIRMAQLRNVVRIEEAAEELGRLRRDLEAWLAHRRAADARGQYETQLETLERTLLAAIGTARAELDAVSPAEPAGQVYRRCRVAERRTVFLRRYWEYFADKWDQRDDPGRGRLLASADELVWSCWSQAFAAAGQPPAAAPLPYLEPHFTPRAIPRVTPPPDLKLVDEVLRDAIRVLPLPVVGVPPVCESAPWWLIHLAHETGHHVQYELGGGRLRPDFATALGQAASQAGADAEVWTGYGEEVFADAFAVLMTGPAAARALSELLEGPPEELVASLPRYPAPVVRLAVMAAVLRDAGLEPRDAEPALDPHGEDSSLPRSEVDVDGLAAAAMRAPASPKPLCGWLARRFTVTGEVRHWRDGLLGDDEPIPAQSRRSARLAVAGAVAAWAVLAETPDADVRQATRERLAARVTALVPECAEPGRRALEAAEAPDAGAARDALLRAVLGERVEALALAG